MIELLPKRPVAQPITEGGLDFSIFAIQNGRTACGSKPEPTGARSDGAYGAAAILVQLSDYALFVRLNDQLFLRRLGLPRHALRFSSRLNLGAGILQTDLLPL